MKTITIFLVAILTTSLSIHVKADSGWRKYKSANFIVYSDYPKKTALKKIHRFELFKKSLHQLLAIPESVETVPFEVYLFKRKSSLRKFTTSFNTSGFYRDRLGHPLMVVGPDTKDAIFFHEYVHFLTYRLGNFVYPRWYSEGIAEFYSTLEFKKEKAVIGRVPWDRRDWLVYEDMLPLESLLEPGEKFKSSRFTGRFYATSWLLAHRMMLGTANDMKDYSQPFKQYLLRHTQGEKGADVFFAELGVDSKELYNDLRRYARKHRWNAIAMQVPEIQSEVLVSELSSQEVVNSQVRLALATNNWDQASELLADNQKTLDTESRAALAIIQGHASDEVGTEEALISELIEAPNHSGAAHAYLGHALFDLAQKRPDNREALLEEALHHLEAAQAQNALYGESALMVKAYWELGRKQAAMIEVSRVLKLNPASLSANVLAGEYSLKAGLTDDARFFLNRVVNWAHSEAQAEKAIRLLAELDGEPTLPEPEPTQPEPT